MRIFLVIAVFFLVCSCKSNQKELGGLTFELNYSITNSNQPYFKPIRKLWENYLLSYKYYYVDNEYWDQSVYPIPDRHLINLLGYLKGNKSSKKIVCKIMGIVPSSNDFFKIKSIFYRVAENGNLNIICMTSIPVRKNGRGFLLMSNPHYVQTQWDFDRVDGHINFYTKRGIDFNEVEASRMSAFNNKLSKIFKTETLSFDLFKTESTEELVKLKGFEFEPSSYQHNQNSGEADVINDIIFTGNNSECHKHELVHFYTHEVSKNISHNFIDEGIATLLGGSAGFHFSWHLSNFQKHIESNPEYKIPQLDSLKGYLPNVENSTLLLYNVGAIVANKIYSEKGIDGLIDALNCGSTNEELMKHLSMQLGLTKVNWSSYILKEIMQLDIEELKESIP